MAALQAELQAKLSELDAANKLVSNLKAQEESNVRLMKGVPVCVFRIESFAL